MNLAYFSDKDFIEKLTEITLANMGDENFSVSDLSRESGIDRAQLNNRLHRIKNISASKFISQVRLQKAHELLLEHNLTAAEIAYKVGFSSPTYFNKCFHEFYGYPPGEMKRKAVEVMNGAGNDQVSNSKPQADNSLSARLWGEIRVLFQKNSFRYIAAGILVFIILLIFVSPNFNFTFRKLKPEEKSIAVLPFKNLSNDEENQYFADGVMEDILNLLYRVGEFRVVSRTSVEQFRESTKSAPEIAKLLGVNFILEGSVQRHDNKLRINIQLIDARNDRQKLSEKYDREFADILAIRSEIAKQVADQLQAALSPNEIKEIEKIPTQNTEAYNLYLKGRFFWNKRTEEGVKKSVECFEKAVQADPDYALAWAGLADGYQILAGYGWYKPREEGHDKSKMYALKALALDNNLAEAHASLGFILSYNEWKWEEAKKELTKAIRLNPNYAFAHQIYIQLLDIMGETEREREQINVALELDPLSSTFHNLSARLYYNEGNFEKALKEAQETLTYDPNNKRVFDHFFLIYYRMGDGDKALDVLQKHLLIDTLNSKYIDAAKQVYTKSGLPGLIKLTSEIWPNDARFYAISGNKEEALACLESYLEKNSGGPLVRLISNLDYESLRAEPRFKAVIDKLGLTEYYLKRAKEPGYIRSQ